MCKPIGYEVCKVTNNPDPATGIWYWPRVYRTARAAKIAARRLGPGWVFAGWVCDCPVPRPDDAEGWDRYRREHGLPMCR